MIIEVKSYGRCGETCAALEKCLEGYDGAYCVESFDPSALRRFKKDMPRVMRGQLSQNYFEGREGLPFSRKLAMSSLLVDFIGRPSFIAYNHRHRVPLAARLLKSAGAARFAAWTVRSDEELEAASIFYDVIIFDSFIPKVSEKNKEAGDYNEDR